MTVPKQVDFSVGTVVSDTFLDRLQEVSAAGAWNCVLQISGTSVQVVATTGQGAAAVVISGHMRYVESTVTVSFTGSDSSGAYGIWAATSSDDNDPSWTLVKISGTGTPSGYAYTRKLGTVSWNGTALSALDQIAGFEKHSHLHQVGAGDELPSNAVGTTQVVDLAVTTGKIAASAVTTAKIADSNVTTGKIADANVTTAKIADANVTTAKIADSNVTTAKIADSNVTAAKIASSAVGTSQIAASAVTTAKIADANVTTTKIADSNVTTDKIADDAVTNSKVSSGAITATELASAVIDQLVPTGVIVPFAGSIAPSGWLLCDGSEKPRLSYAALDAVITTTYSGGSYTDGSGGTGTSHFRVPDLRGRVIAGKDDMGGTAASRMTSAGSGVDGTNIGASGGAQTHTLSSTQSGLPAHTVSADGGHTHSVSTNGNHSHGGVTTDSGAHAHQFAGLSAGAAAGVSFSTMSAGPAGSPFNWQTGAVGNHSHGIYADGNHTHSVTGGSHTHAVTAQNASSAHNNVQPSMILNYIIKY